MALLEIPKHADQIPAIHPKIKRPDARAKFLRVAVVDLPQPMPHSNYYDVANEKELTAICDNQIHHD